MQNTAKITKLIREGNLLLEIELTAITRENDSWSPYFSTSEAQKLYEARKALSERDINTASKFGRLYKLLPLESKTPV